jgi:hypothetical protein
MSRTAIIKSERLNLVGYIQLQCKLLGLAKEISPEA